MQRREKQKDIVKCAFSHSVCVRDSTQKYVDNFPRAVHSIFAAGIFTHFLTQHFHLTVLASFFCQRTCVVSFPFRFRFTSSSCFLRAVWFLYCFVSHVRYSNISSSSTHTHCFRVCVCLCTHIGNGTGDDATILH